jgi:membrane protease YdiL (CAAX protease family)
MPLFAQTLTPELHRALLSVVEVLFLVFVVISFLIVAGYTAWQVSHRRLLAPSYAPLPLVIEPRVVGWLFTVCVLGLIYLQSPFFSLTVMVGIAALILQNQRPAQVQFGFDRLPLIRAQAYGLLVFGAVMLVENPLTDFSDQLFDFLHLPHPEQEAVEIFRHFNGAADIFNFLLLAVVFSPIIEELFFRGFLLTFLKNYTSPTLAIILSAGVFAFAHLNLGIVLPLWFLGIVLGVAYEHTGSLIVPMTIHACFNLATALSIMLDKGTGS